MIAIQSHTNGCILPVRAQPGAKKTDVIGTHAGALKVAVQPAPEKGKANKALIDTLAKALGIKKLQIALLSGAAGRDKRFLLSGIEANEVEAKLTEILTGIESGP